MPTRPMAPRRYCRLPFHGELLLVLTALSLVFFGRLWTSGDSSPQAAGKNLKETRKSATAPLSVQHTRGNAKGEGLRPFGPPFVMFPSTEEEREARLDELFRALDSKEARIRLGAIQDMADLGDERSMNALIQALSDESALVRAAAAEALGRMGDSASVDYLVACLTDSNALVRLCAVRAIGSLGAEEAVGDLMMVLTDSDPEVRIAAVEVLGSLDRAEIVQRVGFVLADGDSRVAETAELFLAEEIVEDVVPSDDGSLTPTQENGGDGEWMPATPSRPGEPTDPSPEPVDSGDPGAVSSGKGRRGD